MSSNIYDIGDKVTITGTFTNSGTVTDPTAVRAKYKTPAGVTTTLLLTGTGEVVTKLSTGVYEFDISITEAGTWQYRMDDVGENVATEGFFTVRASLV